GAGVFCGAGVSAAGTSARAAYPSTDGRSHGGGGNWVGRVSPGLGDQRLPIPDAGGIVVAGLGGPVVQRVPESAVAAALFRAGVGVCVCRAVRGAEGDCDPSEGFAAVGGLGVGRIGDDSRNGAGGYPATRGGVSGGPGTGDD